MPAMEATSNQDLGPETLTKMFYGPDESSFPDVQTSIAHKELLAEKYAREQRGEADRLQVLEQTQARQLDMALSDKKRVEADLRKQTEQNEQQAELMAVMMRRIAGLEPREKKGSRGVNCIFLLPA